MHSIPATARRAGVLYLLFAIIAIVNEFFFPAFVVPQDAAATARNILAAEPVYRLSIMSAFVTHILFILLVVLLYRLFKGVDKQNAMLMVLLVSIGVALALANMLNRIAPLVLLGGANYLSVFTKPQLDALALGFLKLHGNGAGVVTGFWGLWLFPFGILVIKSRYFPRILGVLLLVAGFAYLATSFTSIVLPAYKRVVSQMMMPLYFGEVPIILWLAIMGAKVPPPAAVPSQVD